MIYLRELWWWFESQNAQFQLVLSLSLILLVVSVSLFFTVIRLRSARNRTARLAEELLKELEPVILELIYEEDQEDWNDSIASMRTRLNAGMYEFHSYARVSDYLMNLHKQLEGESAVKVENIYRELGLPERTIELLKTAPWYQKVKALSALAEFRIRGVLFEVIQFMDHKNRLVRDEAQFTAIVLGGKKAVKSIRNLTFQISKWQQLRLIDECEKLGNDIKEEIFTWLQSENETLVELGLRICNRMGWYEVLFNIPALIGHRREEIRLLCIIGVKDMGSSDLIPSLMHRFEVESRSVQLEIVRAIEELDFEGKMKDFLMSQVIYGELEVALQAARSFSANATEEELQSAAQELPADRLRILEHVKYA